jgi:hypothetical protein
MRAESARNLHSLLFGIVVTTYGLLTWCIALKKYLKVLK